MKYLDILEKLADCPEDLQALIRGLIRLPLDDVEKVAKVVELLASGDPVIPDAVEKLTNGSLTRDQFYDVIKNQYRLIKN